MNILLVNAFILGLIGGVIPGPVLTAIFTEVLHGGFLKSIRLIILAFIAESSVALFTMLVFTKLDFQLEIIKIISIVGAGILFWIAFGLWKIKTLDSDKQNSFGLGKITLMILANGMLWTFWITVCIPQALELDDQMSFGAYAFLLVVEIGWLITTTLTAYVFSKFRRLLSQPKTIPILFKIFTIVFIYFGLTLLYDGATYFLPSLT